MKHYRVISATSVLFIVSGLLLLVFLAAEIVVAALI